MSHRRPSVPPRAPAFGSAFLHVRNPPVPAFQIAPGPAPAPDRRPAPITPGTYLRRRREAAGLTRHDVALMRETVPAVSCQARVEWLTAIEQDRTLSNAWTLAALRECFAFDSLVFDQLVDIACFRADLPAPRLCRICACSEFDRCDDNCFACEWTAADLCSACLDVGFVPNVAAAE